MTPDAEPSYDGLDLVTLAVRDMMGASRQLTERTARRMGMNANDMAAIGELTQHGPMGAGELAQRLGIRSASATVLVDRLERAGHVERTRDTVDRRRVTVTATPAALRASHDAWWPTIDAMDAVCRSLSDADRSAVLDLMARLTAVAERGAQEPAAP